ncbi:hypothetical protein C8J57DRAFT_1562927 [Mycena rebaudengoi]|nr:hypothetical protein C8J57DRAFT_1562927 [Mycena rebaudengoi]
MGLHRSVKYACYPAAPRRLAVVARAAARTGHATSRGRGKFTFHLANFLATCLCHPLDIDPVLSIEEQGHMEPQAGHAWFLWLAEDQTRRVLAAQKEKADNQQQHDRDLAHIRQQQRRAKLKAAKAAEELEVDPAQNTNTVLMQGADATIPDVASLSHPATQGWKKHRNGTWGGTVQGQAKRIFWLDPFFGQSSSAPFTNAVGLLRGQSKSSGVLSLLFLTAQATHFIAGLFGGGL